MINRTFTVGRITCLETAGRIRMAPVLEKLDGTLNVLTVRAYDDAL